MKLFTAVLQRFRHDDYQVIVKAPLSLAALGYDDVAHFERVILAEALEILGDLPIRPILVIRVGISEREGHQPSFAVFA